MSPKLKIQYAIANLIALVVFAVVYWQVMQSVAEADALLVTVVVLAVYALVLLVVRRVFAGRIPAERDRAIAYFEEGCDPQRFLRETAYLMKDFPLPCNNLACWFASYYVRALAEVGRVQEAFDLYDKLRANLQNYLEQPDRRVAMIIDLVPATRLLLGGRYALQAVEEALLITRQAGLADDTPRVAYARWERDNLIAQRDGDGAALARSMRATADNNQCSWLVRVECAERESWVHRAAGDVEAEAERLRFVVSHGYQLSCVARAKTRLAELGAACDA